MNRITFSIIISLLSIQHSISVRFQTCYSDGHLDKICKTNGQCYNTTNGDIKSYGCIDKAIAVYACGQTRRNYETSQVERLQCCDSVWCNVDPAIIPRTVLNPLVKIDEFDWKLVLQKKVWHMRFRTQNKLGGEIYVKFQNLTTGTFTDLIKGSDQDWAQLPFENNTLYKIRLRPQINGVRIENSAKSFYFMNLYRHSPIWFVDNSTISSEEPNQIFCEQCIHLIDDYRCQDCIRYNYQEYIPLPQAFFIN